MKTTTTAATTATIITLAFAIGVGCIPVTPPNPPVIKPEPPAPLFTVKGQARASQFLNAEVPSDLGAYLFWMQDNGGFQIDEASVSGELPSSFSLDVIDAPTAAQELSQYPGVAAAGILIAQPQVAEAMLRSNGTGLPPDSVVGIAQVYLVHVADEVAAANLEAGANMALPVGFSLVGPNPEAQACVDAAYGVENSCFDAAYSACDELTDFDAQDECYANIDCDAASEQSAAAVAECPPSSKILDADSVISVELFTASTDESDGEEG